MLTIGKPKEWRNFEERHRQFFDNYSHLQDAQTCAFIRPLPDPTRRDLAVFYLGRLAVEDFQEILLLSGNGSGSAALKILRGMYERLVDGRYLSVAPDSEVENFYSWHYVQKRKLNQELTETMGEDFFEGLGYEDQRQEIEAGYALVRDTFLVDHCEHCSKKRVNFTWSKKSLLQRAAAAGHSIRGLTFAAYYIPLEHTHSSIAAILHRLREADDGSITFQDDVQRGEADLALQYGFLLLLNILDLQRDHFKLEQLDESLKKCFMTYRDIFAPEVDLDQGGGLTLV